MTKLQRKLLKGSIIIAAIGALLSLYMWNVHITSEIAFCTSSCESVITGKYGAILGIPLGALGFGFYTLLIVIQFTRIKEFPCRLKKLISCLNKEILFKIFMVIGWIFTLYLRYLELFVLHEICAYCWGSVAVMVVLTVLEFIFNKKKTN